MGWPLPTMLSPAGSLQEPVACGLQTLPSALQGSPSQEHPVVENWGGGAGGSAGPTSLCCTRTDT